MGSQHHFVVVYDTDTNKFRLDWEARAHFQDGTIWIKDENNLDGGYWTRYDDESPDPQIKATADAEDSEIGSLLRALMIVNDGYKLPASPA